VCALVLASLSNLALIFPSNFFHLNHLPPLCACLGEVNSCNHVSIRLRRGHYPGSCGRRPLHPDKNGDTALHHLAKFYHRLKTDLFERFIKAGVDINARNKSGETPLFILVKQHNGDLYGSTEDQTYKASDFECSSNLVLIFLPEVKTAPPCSMSLLE
jgi:ankyrin repeat protein